MVGAPEKEGVGVGADGIARVVLADEDGKKVGGQAGARQEFVGGCVGKRLGR